MGLFRVIGPRLLLPFFTLLFICLGYRQILGLPSRSLTAHPESTFHPTHVIAFPEGTKREARLREWQDRFPLAKILLVEYPDHWPQQAGLRPSGERMTRFLLEKYGFTPDTVDRLSPAGEGGWYPLRPISEWLALPENREAKAVLIVDFTRLAYYQTGAAGLLPRDMRQRIRFDTLNPPDAQPTTWWKSRYGWKDIATGWLLGTFGLLGGEGETPGPFQPGKKEGKPAWFPKPGEVMLP